MLEKTLFICLITFSIQKLIRSEFTDEFDLISWQKNETPKRESVTFIDTPYIVLNSNIKRVDGKYLFRFCLKFIWSGNLFTKILIDFC